MRCYRCGNELRTGDPHGGLCSTCFAAMAAAIPKHQGDQGYLSELADYAQTVTRLRAEVERLKATIEAQRKDFCSDHCALSDRRELCDENERRRQEVREVRECLERARRIKDEAVAERDEYSEQLDVAKRELAEARRERDQYAIVAATNKDFYEMVADNDATRVVEKLREARLDAEERIADAAYGGYLDALNRLEAFNVYAGDPGCETPTNVDDDLEDAETIGTVRWWHESGDSSVGIPDVEGLVFAPAENVCLIHRDNLVAIQQQIATLREKLPGILAQIWQRGRDYFAADDLLKEIDILLGIQEDEPKESAAMQELRRMVDLWKHYPDSWTRELVAAAVRLCDVTEHKKVEHLGQDADLTALLNADSGEEEKP